MKDNKCPKFMGCNAPICPRDKSSVENSVWFPDESICKAKTKPDWVRKQIKIAKKARDKDTCYDVEFIKGISRIVRPTGMNPDDKLKNAPANFKKASNVPAKRVTANKGTSTRVKRKGAVKRHDKTQVRSNKNTVQGKKILVKKRSTIRRGIGLKGETRRGSILPMASTLPLI